MRRSLLLLLVTAPGCLFPAPSAYPDLKEVYVEVAHVTSATVRQVDFPLPPDSEPAVYVAVRSFELGAIEAQQKLGRLIGQWPPPEAETPDDPAYARSAPALDTSAFPPRDPPVLLLDTAMLAARQESGCYLGHSAYAGDGIDGGGREVIHHLRLLVVNRETELLVLRPGDVSVEVEGLGGLELLAVADADGARLEALHVPPGHEGLVQLFFSSNQVPASLVVRWRIHDEPPPGARAEARGPWAFEARLSRRYVLSPGTVSGLEDAVARRYALPAPRPRPRDPWREPRMEPVGR